MADRFNFGGGPGASNAGCGSFPEPFTAADSGLVTELRIPRSGAHRDHRSMLIKAWQIVDGDYTCFCGEPAVLEIRTSPDADPGLSCARHGLEWFELVTAMYRRPSAPSPQDSPTT